MILGICGAGGSGREVLEIARAINNLDNRWSDIVFIETEDYLSKNNNQINAAPVYTLNAVLQNYGSEQVEFIVSVGEPILRKKIAEEILGSGCRLATLIHPTVHIPDTTKIGNGVIICYNVFISCNVIIEDNVLVLPLSSVAHDSHIGKNTVIAGHSDIAGGVKIGSNTYIALNVCVRELVQIGSDVVASAGSAVLNDVPDNVIIHGNPAKAIMKKDDRTVFGNRK